MTSASREPGRDFDMAHAMSRASILLIVFISALIVYSAFHVDCDKTQRSPVVTWYGPARAWGPRLGTILFVATAVARVLAILGGQERRPPPRSSLAPLAAMALSVLNGTVSLFFIALLYED